MALNGDLKRQAMSAPADVRGQIQQVEATGSTNMAINQPQLDPEIANMDASRMRDWRDTQGMESMREEKREMQHDISAPGE